MTDRTESSSRMIGGQGAIERTPPSATTSGEVGVIGEFVDAARTAAESLLQEQKRQVADRVSGVAQALQGAVRSLDQTQNRVIARYVQQAGEQIESLAHSLEKRRWSELVADTEEFARRQPTLFVLSAVAAGFLVGRFLWTTMSVESQRSAANLEVTRRETNRAVTAAVSSGSGTSTSETAGHAAGASGAMGSP